jgi:hypothetical protein
MEKKANFMEQYTIFRNKKQKETSKNCFFFVTLFRQNAHLVIYEYSLFRL